MSSEPGPQTPPPHDPFGDNLALDAIRAGAGRNFAVTALAKGGVQLAQLVTLLVLARLLAPADFGVVAMVAAVIGVADLFRDLGLTAATIRLPKITSTQVNTLFWINVSFGAVLTAIGWAASPLLPHLLADPRVAVIGAALSCNFVVNGLAAQHLALLRRNLRFADVARINLTTALTGNAVALTLALFGAAYWALVAAALTANLLTMLNAWRLSGWRPSRPAWDPTVRPMLAFGGWLVGFGLLGYLAQNLQSVLLGRTRGAATAGLYTRASALLNLPLGYLLEPLRTIAPSTLSRIGEEAPGYREYYLSTLRLLCLAVAPLSAFVVVCAPDIVALLLGARWSESGEILRRLACASLPQVLCSTTGWLYMSRGDSRGMMTWGMFGWTVVIAAMLGGLPWGATGVASAYALAMFGITVPCLLYACRGTGITLLDVWSVTWRPLLAALAAGAIGAALLVEMQGFNRVARLAAIGVGGASVYLLLLVAALHQGEYLRGVWAQLRAVARPA
jgi:O-antigen/teichoic acid export membrane protein